MTSPIDNPNDTIGPEPILGDHVNMVNAARLTGQGALSAAQLASHFANKVKIAKDVTKLVSHRS